MAESISSRVIAIIADQARRPVAEIGPETTLEALAIDSIGLVETIFALEEVFDIRVPFNVNAPDSGGVDLRSVGAVVAAVEALVAARAG